MAAPPTSLPAPAGNPEPAVMADCPVAGVAGPSLGSANPDWLGTLLGLILVGLDGCWALVEWLQRLPPTQAQWDLGPIKPWADSLFQSLARLRLRQPLGS